MRPKLLEQNKNKLAFRVIKWLFAGNNNPFALKPSPGAANTYPSAKRAPKAHLADARALNCLAMATERLAKQEKRHLQTQRTHFRDANATNPTLHIGRDQSRNRK
jgi:hypothetical protein